MEFKMCSLSGTSAVEQINVCHKSQSDIIVPDTKPDVFKILSAKALVDLNSCHTKKDKITFSGNIKYNIFYISEEEQNKICTIEYTAPFSHMTEKSGIVDDMITKCATSVSNVTCDIVNSRKVCASAKVNIMADAFVKGETEVISGEEIPDSLAFQTKEYTHDVLRAKNSFEFTVSDSVSICGGEKFDIYDIMAYEDISEIKAVNNKAVIKGQVNVFVLYDNSGDISGYNTEIPFTEIVDIENLSSDQTLVSHFEISSVNYTLPESSEETDLNISVTLKGNIWSYESTTSNFATDMYSPDYMYDIRLKNCKLSKVSDVKTSSITLKDTLVLSDSSASISKVHCAFCTISKDDAKLSGGSLKISGNMESVAICSDSSDNLFSVKGSSPFETEFDFHDCKSNPEIFADVSLVNSSYVLTSSSDIQIRAVAKVNASIIEENEISVITSFSVDEKSPVKKDEQPSILVYYPGEGESLWNIAKKYNTTCEEIISVNSLDKEKTVSEGVPVLITKRYVK